jgi:nucleoside-diphosphate-sugar epimerase
MTFVSVVDVPVAIRNPILTCDGISATVNMLVQSVEHKVEKILYASSGFIYGNAPVPISERCDPQPLNPYNIAKATGEHYVKFFNAHYKLPCVILRYAPTYGPRRNIGPINDYILSMLQGNRTQIYGYKTRDYIYVQDVALANLIALEAVENFAIYNIGTGVEVCLQDIYKLIAELLGVDNNPELCESKNSEIDRFVLDVSKADIELGFKHNVNIKSGLQKTIDWVREKYGL